MGRECDSRTTARGRTLGSAPRWFSGVDAEVLRNRVGPVLVGRYVLEAVLGAGSDAVVFEAFDNRVGRRVAVKVLHPRYNGTGAKKLEQEASLAAVAHHPNICALLDVGEQAGVPFLVLELLEGSTLADRLAAHGAMRVAEALDVFAQILSAIHATHEAGIVHRDVKPSNIVLVPRAGWSPHVKLIDFGVSRRRRSGATESSGSISGTAFYMPPEQARGQDDLDPRADVYAVGITLAEAVTGRHDFRSRGPTPFDDCGPADLGLLRGELPTTLFDVLEVAVASDRTARFASAAAMLRALGRVRHADCDRWDTPTTRQRLACGGAR